MFAVDMHAMMPLHHLSGSTRRNRALAVIGAAFEAAPASAARDVEGEADMVAYLHVVDARANLDDLARDRCEYFGHSFYRFDRTKSFVIVQLIADTRHIDINYVAERMLGVIGYSESSHVAVYGNPFMVIGET